MMISTVAKPQKNHVRLRTQFSGSDHADFVGTMSFICHKADKRLRSGFVDASPSSHSVTIISDISQNIQSKFFRAASSQRPEKSPAQI
jgi:hypothetical protein